MNMENHIIAPSRLAMVPFVSVENMMKLVHHIGLETMLTGLAKAIEDDFRRWELFDKTPRVGSHSDLGVIELMPTSDGTMYGFKYVNGHPSNTRQGLQTVTAFGLLADVQSGYPKLLSEMTVLTALRTAAMSAVATRHLAPKGATTMAMIGNGAQSEFQSLAIKAVCGIDTVRLYDVDPAATDKAIRNLEGRGLTLVRCSSVEDAVEGAQIITTATADKANQQILTDNLVGAGVHINAIGGDCPARRNCTATSSPGHRSSWNTRPRPVSKAKSSRWTPTTRSRSFGKSSPAQSRAERAPQTSPFSTVSASRSRISRPCATSTTASRTPPTMSIST